MFCWILALRLIALRQSSKLGLRKIQAWTLLLSWSAPYQFLPRILHWEAIWSVFRRLLTFNSKVSWVSLSQALLLLFSSLTVEKSLSKELAPSRLWPTSIIFRHILTRSLAKEPLLLMIISFHITIKLRSQQ